MIYVDQASIPYKGRPRHHMTGDSLEELHCFAQRIGIARCWFHRGAKHPHYDVTDEQRDSALAAGALAVGSKDIVRVATRLRVIA